MALRLRPLDDASAPAWDAFVAAMPGGTFFHRAAWSRVIEKAFGHRCHHTLAEQDGAIVGVLPLAHVRTRLFGNTLISTPFCVYGGALAADRETAAALEAHAEAIAGELGASCLELRERQNVDCDWPARPDLYVTFRKPIAGDDDRNMKAIPRKQRAMVRKGIQNGLRLGVQPRRWPCCIASMPRACAISELRCSRAATSRILNEAFGDCSDVVTVLDADQPIAAVLNFYFRDEVLPYYGGGTAAGASSGRQRLHVLGGDAPRRGPWLPPVRFRPQQKGHRCVLPSNTTGASSRNRCTTATISRLARRYRTTIR